MNPQDAAGAFSQTLIQAVGMVQNALRFRAQLNAREQMMEAQMAFREQTVQTREEGLRVREQIAKLQEAGRSERAGGALAEKTREFNAKESRLSGEATARTEYWKSAATMRAHMAQLVDDKATAQERTTLNQQMEAYGATNATHPLAKGQTIESLRKAADDPNQLPSKVPQYEAAIADLETQYNKWMSDQDGGQVGRAHSLILGGYVGPRGPSPLGAGTLPPEPTKAPVTQTGAPDPAVAAEKNVKADAFNTAILRLKTRGTGFRQDVSGMRELQRSWGAINARRDLFSLDERKALLSNVQAQLPNVNLLSPTE